MIHGVDYFGFVYIWYDRWRKKLCIGSHFGAYDDGYVTSTGHMPRAYKRRPAHFMRRIIHWSDHPDRKELLKAEQRWLDLIPEKELGKRFYNLKKQASGRRPELGTKLNPEHRKAIGDGNRGKIHGPLSEAHRQKIRAKHLGRTITPEWRSKISASKKGKRAYMTTEATRQKLREATRRAWKRRNPNKRDEMGKFC